MPRTALTFWLTLEMVESWGWKVLILGIRRKRRKTRRRKRIKRRRKRKRRNQNIVPADVLSLAPKLPLTPP